VTRCVPRRAARTLRHMEAGGGAVNDPQRPTAAPIVASSARTRVAAGRSARWHCGSLGTRRSGAVRRRAGAPWARVGQRSSGRWRILRGGGAPCSGSGPRASGQRRGVRRPARSPALVLGRGATVLSGWALSALHGEDAEGVALWFRGLAELATDGSVTLQTVFMAAWRTCCCGAGGDGAGRLHEGDGRSRGATERTRTIEAELHRLEGRNAGRHGRALPARGAVR